MYWGLGAKIKDNKKDIELGVRAVGGVTYDFPHHPVDIFIEVIPVIELTPDAGLGIDAGVGIRYYFN